MNSPDYEFISDYANPQKPLKDDKKSSWYSFTFETYEVDYDKLIDNMSVWLSDLHLKGLWVSPIHHEDGKEGKPHRHIVLEFTVKHGKDWARFIGQKYIGNGVANGLIFPCDKIATLKYLCHLEHADKEQFPLDSVLTLYGDNYEDIIKNSADVSIADIIKDIQSLKIWEYCDLCDYYAFNGYSNKLKYCVNKCYAVQSYFQSMRNYTQKPKDRR